MSSSSESTKPKRVSFDVPIYWINLQHRSDRRIRMLKNELSGIPNPHIRITPKFDKNQPNAISCCKSHYEAVYTAWRDGAKLALIVEDDVVGLKDMIFNSKFFEALVSEAVAEGRHYSTNWWNVIQLHYVSPGFVQMAETFSANETSSQHHLVKGYLMSCACYLISRKGMILFLSKMSTLKLTKWICLYENNIQTLTNLTDTEHRKLPGYCSDDTSMIIGCTFGENSTPEEFIYGHFDPEEEKEKDKVADTSSLEKSSTPNRGVYFSLFPLVNTFEEVGGSDIPTSQSKVNYENMVLVRSLYRKNDFYNLSFDNFSRGEHLELSEGVHWLPEPIPLGAIKKYTRI